MVVYDSMLLRPEDVWKYSLFKQILEWTGNLLWVGVSLVIFMKAFKPFEQST